MDTTQLYKKVGRRYIPVQRNDAWEYFKKGFYLVYVRENGMSCTSRVFPEKVKLQAAYKEKTDKIAKAITLSLKMQPPRKKLTKKQMSAWKAFEKAMGKEAYSVEFNSIQEIIHDIEKVLLDE